LFVGAHPPEADEQYVHIPWTWAAFTGADSNPLSAEDPAHPLEWGVTLFAVPLLTAITGVAASREAEREAER
jgi:hypothetical protein